MTTKERLDGEIKILGPRINETLKGLIDFIDNEVVMETQIMMHDVKNLVTPGTPAFEKESTYAINQIKKQILKGLVEHYKSNLNK